MDDNTRVRLVFFGSGSPLSLTVYRAVAARHDVAAVVVPGAGGWRTWLRRETNELAREAAAANIRVFHYKTRDADSLAKKLRKLNAALIVVATFPYILPSALLGVTQLGAINVHQSLLPRRRGSDPLFWAYHMNDAETGTTVHWIDAGCDTGDVIEQERVAITRGLPVRQLYMELAERGAAQTVSAIDSIERGDAPRVPQDHASATQEPSPLKSDWRVEFDRWPAERTWHFVSGVAELYGPICRAPNGERLPLGQPEGWRAEAHQRTPGTWERDGDRLRLYCPDGVVEVRAPTSSVSAPR